MRTAAALVIGNELLSGKITDKNVVVLARELRALGVLLKRVVMTLDDIDVIASEVLALSSSHDVVFTSGGVGPTHDDVTIDAVARAFGVGVESAPSIERLLRGYYGVRLTDAHLLMARVPVGCRLVSSAEVPWPTVVMRNVWVLPGVPEVFRIKMPLVREQLGADVPFVSKAVYSTLDEGQIKAQIDEVVAAFRDVEVGSYPAWSEPTYKTKITFDGRDEPRVCAARDAFTALLPPDAVLSKT